MLAGSVIPNRGASGADGGPGLVHICRRDGERDPADRRA